MLEISNRYIDKSVYEILLEAKSELTNGKLDIVEDKGANVKVTCPVHANGHEHNPSCYVRTSDGIAHCFTCGFAGPLQKFIGECFDRSEEFGESWLIRKFGGELWSSELHLEPIELTKKVDSVKIIDESILYTYESYHPYMTQRKLSDEVIKKFNIKYDPKTKSIVFPMRDRNGRLIGFTSRSVEGRKFTIDTNFNKKNIYLLYNIINEKSREVFVCESQINALTLESWGYPAIAMVGAGTTKEQIDELNSTDVKHYILCYDSDNAGEKGRERFKRFIRKDVFVDDLRTPIGKDINDLSKEEFEKLIKDQLYR